MASHSRHPSTDMGNLPSHPLAGSSANGKFFSSGAALSQERIMAIASGKPVDINSNDAK